MDPPLHHNTRTDVEEDHDGLLEGTSDPLLADRDGSPPAGKEVNNTRLLLFAGPSLLLW